MFRIGLSFLLTLLATLAHGADGINNLVVAQRPNAGLVDIRYDLLHSNAGPLNVTVQISTNGGVSYNLPATSFTGDIGLVTTGANKTITWTMAADWPNKFSTNVYFRLQTSVPPPANMALIPAGTFTMGDTIGDGNIDETPTHTVSVAHFTWTRI